MSRVRLTVAAAVVAGLVAVALAVLGQAPPAGADSVTDRKNALDKQISALQDTLEGASASLVTAAVAVERSKAELVDARAGLATAQGQLALAQRLDAQLASRLAFAQGQLDSAVEDLQGRQAAEVATRSALGRIARETYVGSGLTGLSVALQAGSADDFAERLAVAEAALRAQNGTIDELAVQQADMRARGLRLDAVRAEVASLKAQSAAVVVQRQQAQQVAAAAADRVSTLVTQQQASVRAIQANVAAEKARIDALQGEQAKLEAVLVARAQAAAAAAEADRRRRAASGGGAPAPPPRASGYLSMPADGPITSGFGMRYHPILHISRLHSGTDFGIPCGTPVHAAAAGTVVSAGWAGGYGNRIVIDHGMISRGDLATTYNHLSRIVVGSGSVSRGEVIAYSGTTGLSTGCHLHFETLINGAFVDPMGFL